VAGFVYGCVVEWCNQLSRRMNEVHGLSAAATSCRRDELLGCWPWHRPPDATLPTLLPPTRVRPRMTKASQARNVATTKPQYLQPHNRRSESKAASEHCTAPSAARSIATSARHGRCPALSRHQCPLVPLALCLLLPIFTLCANPRYRPPVR
jgi:hypothetical protein